MNTLKEKLEELIAEMEIRKSFSKLIQEAAEKDYQSNEAAISAGLVIGSIYRTGGTFKVVI
jgi:hypothetical protein